MLVRVWKTACLAVLTVATTLLVLLAITLAAMSNKAGDSSGIGAIAGGGSVPVIAAGVVFLLAFWFFWRRSQVV